MGSWLATSDRTGQTDASTPTAAFTNAFRKDLKGVEKLEMMMERIIKPPEEVGKIFCCEGLKGASKKDSCEEQQFSNLQQQRSQIPDRFLLAHRKAEQEPTAAGR